MHADTQPHRSAPPEEALYDAIWAIGRAVDTLHLRTPAKRMMRQRCAAARQAFIACFPARTPHTLFPLKNHDYKQPKQPWYTDN